MNLNQIIIVWKNLSQSTGQNRSSIYFWFSKIYKKIKLSFTIAPFLVPEKWVVGVKILLHQKGNVGEEKYQSGRDFYYSKTVVLKKLLREENCLWNIKEVGIEKVFKYLTTAWRNSLEDKTFSFANKLSETGNERNSWFSARFAVEQLNFSVMAAQKLTLVAN